MKKLIIWIVVVVAIGAAGYAVVTFVAGPAILDFIAHLTDPERDVGETIVDRIEKSPHDDAFSVVIARVLSKTKGTPIKWSYVDQTGTEGYNLREPAVVIDIEKQPTVRWVKSRHIELCTSRRAYVWEHHYSRTGGGTSHSGSINGDDLLFEFKNPDGSLRWTVSVTKAC